MSEAAELSGFGVFAVLLIELVKRIPLLKHVPESWADFTKFGISGLMAAVVTVLHVLRGEVDLSFISLSDRFVAQWGTMLLLYTGVRIVATVRNRVGGSAI